jgi:ankyrin repeat protein
MSACEECTLAPSLHQAALAGHRDCIVALAGKKSSKDLGVNARNADGSTPLHLACFNGRVEAVK